MNGAGAGNVVAFAVRLQILIDLLADQIANRGRQLLGKRRRFGIGLVVRLVCLRSCIAVPREQGLAGLHRQTDRIHLLRKIRLLIS